MGFFAIAAGRLSDRFGPRGVLVLSAVATGLAYVLMYFLSAPWQLLLIYGVLVGFGLAAHDVVTLSTIAHWFPKRRGTMSGVVKVGTAIGQMIIPVVAVALIAAVGWRSAFVVPGIGATVLLLTAAWLMGITPVTDKSDGKQVDKTDGLSFAEARQGPQFWTLCAIQFFFFGTLITIPIHIVPHSIDSSLTAAHAATVLSTIAAGSIAGRLLTGNFVDRIGGKRCIDICLLLLFLSLISLLFIEDAKLLYTFAIVYGFAHGGLFTVVSPTVAGYFGMKAHGVIFGVIVCTGTIVGALLPIATGMFFDNQQTYDLAFALMAAMILSV